MASVVTPVFEITIQLARQCASISKYPDPVGLSHIKQAIDLPSNAQAAADAEVVDESPEKAAMRQKVADLRELVFRIAMRMRLNPRSNTVQQVVYR